MHRKRRDRDIILTSKEYIIVNNRFKHNFTILLGKRF